jgi:hypothetical protein
MKTLSDYIETAQAEAFKKYGAFFAFGNRQFDEKKQPGVVYVDMGAGLICPKQNAPHLHSELIKIGEEGIHQDVRENGAEAIIQREYFNYETQLTMDTTRVDESMDEYAELYPDLFTNEIRQLVYKRCFEKAVENDWF